MDYESAAIARDKIAALTHTATHGIRQNPSYTPNLNWDKTVSDLEKWLDSEKAGVDRCGTYPHCAYCRKEEEYEYTCARAVRIMLIALRKSSTK